MTDNTNRRASPKESEGLELPPLPKPPRHVTKHPQIGEMYDRIGLHAFAIKYASEAVEADRRAREVAHISEMAQWARDNGLNVPVEWSGRAQQPAPAAAAAASIDTPEFRQLLDAVDMEGRGNYEITSAALIAHIDAKLAEARREGGS